MDKAPFDPGLAASMCRKFCLLYSSLSLEPNNIKNDLWRVKPKMHLFQELAEEQTFALGNPKDFWAYKDESFMGFLASLACTRGGGSKAHTVPLRTIERYRGLCHDGIA
eukprot:10672075-Lingulodinium_polyedra.AAC.1